MIRDAQISRYMSSCTGSESRFSCLNSLILQNLADSGWIYSKFSSRIRIDLGLIVSCRYILNHDLWLWRCSFAAREIAEVPALGPKGISLQETFLQAVLENLNNHDVTGLSRVQGIQTDPECFCRCKKHQKVSFLSCSCAQSKVWRKKSNRNCLADPEVVKVSRQLSNIQNSIDLISFELMLLGIAWQQIRCLWDLGGHQNQM